MTPEELELAQRRLAIETKLKRRDQRLAEKQFQAQMDSQLAERRHQEQTDKQKTQGWKFFLTPSGVVLAGAAIGLIGTATGKWADYISARKQHETNIILKASEVDSKLSPEAQTQQRARNLLWFVECGYLSFEESYIQTLRKESALKPNEKVPTPIINRGTYIPGFNG